MGCESITCILLYPKLLEHGLVLRLLTCLTFEPLCMLVGSKVVLGESLGVRLARTGLRYDNVHVHVYSCIAEAALYRMHIA